MSAATTASMNPVNVIFSGTIISRSHELLPRNDAGSVIAIGRSRASCADFIVSVFGNGRRFFNRFTPL
jgi:hypothetical protein